MFDIKAWGKKYYQENKERILEQVKKYYENNREKKLEYSKKYDKEHCEEKKEYYVGHQEKYKQYRINNRVKILQSGKQWRINHPEKAKERLRRHQNKRERNLGFEPLNKYFEGSVAHHIDKTYIVYIPEEIHNKIRHCLENGKNMEEINKIAMNYI